MAAKTFCPPKKLNGKEPKITEKYGQVYPEAVFSNNKAIESEPADSGRHIISRCCQLRMFAVGGWSKFSASRKKMGRSTVFLKGPDNGFWPVIYHENFGSKVLAGNWALFAAVYGLKPGDDCLFLLSTRSKRMFNVHVAHKKGGAPFKLELLTLQAPFLDVNNNGTEQHFCSVNDISLLGQTDENGHHMGLISRTSLKSAENGGKGNHLECVYNEESHCTSNNQVTGEKSNEPSQFGITAQLATSFREQEEDGKDYYLSQRSR